MKTILMTLALALTLSSSAFACVGGKDGECCSDKKVATTDVTAADSALAEQAARAMFDSDQPRPDGKLSDEAKAKLAEGSAAITKSLKEGGHANHTCPDGETCNHCSSGGECKECCAGKKNATSTSMKEVGSTGVLDGRTVALKGKCPDHHSP